MLEAKVSLLDGMEFVGTSSSGHKVTMDTSPAGGEQDKGPRPIELLLIALGGCTGMDVIGVLRKMRQNVTGYEIIVRGERATEHPMVYTEITVEHVVKGKDVSPDAVKRAVELSETKYCSVGAMLGKAAKVTHTYTVVDE